MNSLRVKAMAIILDTTCWYLFPEGKVLKLRHKMNTECHKKKSPGKIPCWKPTYQSLIKFNSTVFSGIGTECCFLLLDPIWNRRLVLRGSCHIKVPLLTPVSHSVWWNALTVGSLWELKLTEGTVHLDFCLILVLEKKVNEWNWAQTKFSFVTMLNSKNCVAYVSV